MRKVISPAYFFLHVTNLLRLGDGYAFDGRIGSCRYLAKAGSVVSARVCWSAALMVPVQLAKYAFTSPDRAASNLE
jgi:hypothetical protein